MNPNDRYIYEHAARQRELAQERQAAWARMQKQDLPPLDPSASDYRPRSVHEFIARRHQ